jgi:hypothetical protein
MRGKRGGGEEIQFKNHELSQSGKNGDQLIVGKNTVVFILKPLLFFYANFFKLYFGGKE